MAEEMINIRKGYIYRHWVINDKGIEKSYIGQTVKEKPYRRWGRKGNGYAPYNEGKATRFYNAIQKYGWDSFHHDIILIIECANTDELHFWLNEWEQYYIEKYDSFNNGYNSTLGGNKGLSGELNPMYNIGERHPMYGKHHSYETKQRISKSVTGIKQTEETRRKISIAMSGKGNPMYGKKHSQESIQKMKDHRSDQTGGKNPNARKVICTTTGDVFPTAKEGGEWCGLKTVAKAAKNRGKAGKHPISGVGLYWMYYDEWLESQNNN